MYKYISILSTSTFFCGRTCVRQLEFKACLITLNVFGTALFVRLELFTVMSCVNYLLVLNVTAPRFMCANILFRATEHSVPSPTLGSKMLNVCSVEIHKCFIQKLDLITQISFESLRHQCCNATNTLHAQAILRRSVQNSSCID